MPSFLDQMGAEFDFAKDVSDLALEVFLAFKDFERRPHQDTWDLFKVEARRLGSAIGKVNGR